MNCDRNGFYLWFIWNKFRRRNQIDIFKKKLISLLLLFSMKMESEMKMKISVLAIGKLRRMLYYRVFHNIKRNRQKMQFLFWCCFAKKQTHGFIVQTYFVISSLFILHPIKTFYELISLPKIACNYFTITGSLYFNKSPHIY